MPDRIDQIQCLLQRQEPPASKSLRLSHVAIAMGHRSFLPNDAFSIILRLLFVLWPQAMPDAGAAEWSDAYIGYRYGTRFAEPYLGNGIHKRIVNFGFANRYECGTHFFNADVLGTDSRDPRSAGSPEGAVETYIVYRHTLDLGRPTSGIFDFGIVRGIGLTAGFDLNHKDDAGYNSRKKMLVAGATLMLDVPGFLNVSLLQLWESNAPCSTFTRTCVSRFDYAPHPMLSGAWAIPINGSNWSFEGYGHFISSKRRDEFGAPTRSETNIDMQFMYDLHAVVQAPPPNRTEPGAAPDSAQLWQMTIPAAASRRAEP